MEGGPLEFYLLVREKTMIMQMIEVGYRRLNADVIKEKIHVKLYGKETEMNELTKVLIKIGQNGKKEMIKDFKASCSELSIET